MTTRGLGAPRSLRGVLTRRTALATGVSGLALAGCGGRPARTVAGLAADIPILGAALEVERTQIAVYEVGLGLVDDEQRELVRTILAHERRHAMAIAEAIEELGGSPARARPAAEYRRDLPDSADAWRRFAVAAEEEWAAGYAAALPRFANKRLRGTFGAIMAAEAQHAVALGLPR